MFKFSSLLLLVVVLANLSCTSNGWVSLFDGKSLKGWQASENKDSWVVEDGMLVTSGPRSHLFYAGDVQDHNFKNFELSVDVKTTPGSNSGIYFHTEYQEEGWPSKGYECQVLNSSGDAAPGEYVEHKMTSSIYAIRNVWKAPVPDGEWFNYRIVVQGKTVQTYINDQLMAEYTEPDSAWRPDNMQGRRLGSGTFALQCHDPDSKVYYKNIKVKPLPDDLETPGTPLDDPELEQTLVTLGAQNFPLMDLHVHLKGGLTKEAALAHARKYGFTYGFAVNCGVGNPISTEDSLQQFLATYEQPPQSFLAMQAEGREWLDIFTTESINKFDYAFTDAMTWTNSNGTRMRLWIPSETEVGDPQDFMEQLVSKIETIVSTEPIDIYVNPTYLPDEINDRYDELWTPARMYRVVKALVDNQVALEINARYKIPSPAFLKLAKEAGAKFTFGTNNTGADDLGHLQYCLDMIKECGLQPGDMWIPQMKE